MQDECLQPKKALADIETFNLRARICFPSEILREKEPHPYVQLLTVAYKLYPAVYM